MENDIDNDAAFEVAADEPVSGVLDASGHDLAEQPQEITSAASTDARRRSHAQARIDEVTRARREAERERDYWRERAGGDADSLTGREKLPERFESMDPRYRGPAGRDEREGDGPSLDSGEMDPQALLTRIREEARAELMEEAAAYGEARAAQEAAVVWEDRQASFASQRPDYVEAVMGASWACSETMADAIQDSDAGPALAYHLARNPDEAARIAALSPLGQVRALGRIEAGLVEGASGGGAALAVSHAPAPPPSVRGSGGRFRPAPDTGDFAAFDRAYGAR